jgi:aspartate aminotransferase-like enzyme
MPPNLQPLAKRIDSQKCFYFTADVQTILALDVFLRNFLEFKFRSFWASSWHMDKRLVSLLSLG